MAGPFYRITIHDPSEVEARTDGTVKFEVFVEIDELGDGNWAALPDSPNHFDVLMPHETIDAIFADPALDTEAKKRVALRAAIIAADDRLSSLREADNAARKSISWLNLRSGPQSWTYVL